MPTLRKDRDNAWLARVIVHGKTVETKFFPAGRHKGPEWMAARKWEIERKKEYLAGLAKKQTLTGYALLMSWGDNYLSFAERTMSHSTVMEKKAVMRDLFAYCGDEGINDLEKLTKPVLYQFLVDVADERGAKRANVYRKNILSAWNWGINGIDGFPQIVCPLEFVKPFPADYNERYVPPEEDVIRVLQQAEARKSIFLQHLGK